MKVVKRTATPTFTSIVLEITLESQKEFDQFNIGLEYAYRYNSSTPPSFSDICQELCATLKK